MLKSKIARVVSEISNGFLTMILSPVIAIAISPLDNNKKILFGSLVLLTTVLPYALLKKTGKISDYELTKREERPPYFIVISILFFIFFLVILNQNIYILTKVFLNLFLVSSVVTIITFFWKISGHMTYSTILFTTLLFLFPNYPTLLLLFFFTPFIGWSRVILKKHTLTQVTLGTLLPLLLSICVYWPFW